GGRRPVEAQRGPGGQAARGQPRGLVVERDHDPGLPRARPDADRHIRGRARRAAGRRQRTGAVDGTVIRSVFVSLSSVLPSRVLVGALVPALLSCGPAAAGDRQPSWRRPQEVASSAARGPMTLEPAPEAPAARAYHHPPVAPAPPAPVPDGRLYAAAAELAAVTPQDGTLVYSLIEFALQRNGIIEPSPHLVVIWGPVEDGSEIVASLAERLPAILGAGTFARVGVG